MQERITDVQQIGAKEVSRLLGVNPNRVYSLWNEGKMSYWCIAGTKKTTKEAVAQFLLESQLPETKSELSD